jgi:integrase
MLHFEEKGGKSREIPVRHDLQELISAYIDAANLRDAPKDTALFQSALKKKRRLTGKAIHVNDICRMMKRRLKDIGLPLLFLPHSFRVIHDQTNSRLTETLEQLDEARAQLRCDRCPHLPEVPRRPRRQTDPDWNIGGKPCTL